MQFVISPAYGRDYPSAEAARRDFADGKDFVHESALHTGGGRYISRRDMDTGDEAEIRYAKKTRLTLVRVNKEGEK